MKSRLLLVILPMLAWAAVLAFRGQPPAAGQSAPPARTRPVPREIPFWKSAVVSEPIHFRNPTAVPEIQTRNSPVDHPARITGLLRSGDDARLQVAAIEWFEADPAAARDWLAAQESLESLQPALAMIACRVAGHGEPAQALEWAALLDPGPGKDQAIYDIHAYARQYFTEAQLRAAPLPPDRIERLLGGAAAD